MMNAEAHAKALAAEKRNLEGQVRYLIATLRVIAEFPHHPGNRDLTFSEGMDHMAAIASEAVRKAEGRE